MTYEVLAAGIELPHNGYDWKVQTGLAAPFQGWVVPNHIAESIVKQYAGKEIELKLHNTTVKRVVVIGNTAARDPQNQTLILTDVRWYWTRGWLVRDFNVRRRVGNVRLVGEVPDESKTPVYDVQYLAWTLAATNTPWVWQPAVEHLLTYASRAVEGRPSILWQIDTTSLRAQGASLTVQETRIDDEIPVGIARGLAALPGRTGYVDLEGVFHVSDGTLGAEIATISSLKPDEALQGQGSLTLCDLRGSRSNQWRVRFTPEYEVKVWADKLATRQVDDPYFENVLKIPDKRLTVGTGAQQRNVGQGTYLVHEDAYAAWGPATEPVFASGPLTEDMVRTYWLSDNLAINFALMAAETPDPIWSARIREVKKTFRTLFRVNPKFWARVLSALPVRAAVDDPQSGTRGPSPVFSDYALKPTVRWFNAAIRKTGYNVSGFGKPNDGIPASTQDMSAAANHPAPATLHMLDEEQGIFEIVWHLPSDGLYDAIAPCGIESDSNLDPALANGFPSSWISRKLVSRHKMATIISCVPAAPNSDKRLFEVSVSIQDAAQTLGLNSVPSATGPDKVLRCRATTARIAWADDQNTRDRILKAFGDDPSGSVSATDPSLTVASLDPVNYDNEILPLAKAMAAQDLAGQLDHYEGTLAVPMTTIAPVGSIQSVTYRVTEDSADTIVQCVGSPVAIDPLALLPGSARKTLLREVQP